MLTHNSTTHLLSQNAFWRLPKIFVESIGLHKAFVLCTIIDKSEYFTSNNQCDNNGWFYYKKDDILKLLPVAEKTLRDILKYLIDLNLIEMELRQKGLDRRNYFRINAVNIAEFISNCLIEKLKENEIQSSTT